MLPVDAVERIILQSDASSCIIAQHSGLQIHFTAIVWLSRPKRAANGWAEAEQQREEKRIGKSR